MAKLVGVVPAVPSVLAVQLEREERSPLVADANVCHVYAPDVILNVPEVAVTVELATENSIDAPAYGRPLVPAVTLKLATPATGVTV